MTDWTLPTVNVSLCNRCGACVQQCPTGAVEMEEEGPVIARPHDCTYCALCDTLCPEGAITCGYEIVWGSESQNA